VIVRAVYFEATTLLRYFGKGKLHPKAKARYTGPYKILNVMEHNLYEVEDEAGKRYVYHVSRLISYVPRIMPNDSSLTVE
jgi:hypothetical protein